MDHASACNTCVGVQDKYKCDNETLKCTKTNDTGSMKSACDQDCGKIVPTQLLGTWRGLMVKKGPVGMFDMGEIDMKFGDSNLTVTYPNKTQDIYDVSTTGFGKITLKKGD